jgi:hypothetical protein
LADITQQRIHVNVGIEGNTNHSFLSEFGSIYGSEHVLVYQLDKREFIRLSDNPLTPSQSILKIGRGLLENTPLFNQSSEDKSTDQSNGQTYSRRNLPQDTAAVFGYYTPSFFKGILENPFISIILKDPLERMISLFDDWTVNQGNVDWRKSIPYKQGITFNEFALEESFTNFQSKCLGSRRLGDFDLVGLAECQAGFIAQLKNKDWKGYINPKTTQIQFNKPKYRNLGITPEFLEEFQTLNEMDYSIYQQAKEFIGYC